MFCGVQVLLLTVNPPVPTGFLSGYVDGLEILDQTDWSTIPTWSAM